MQRRHFLSSACALTAISALPLAARALIRDGTPIDPYRRSEP